MKKYKYITFLFLLSSFFLRVQGKEVQLTVFDHKIKKNIVISVDSISGTYFVHNVSAYLKTKVEVSPINKKKCEMYIEELESEMVYFRDYDLPEIKWTLFKDVRELDYLGPEIKRKLNAKGFNPDELINLSQFSVAKLEIKKILWNDDSLSLLRDDFLNASTVFIKEMLQGTPTYRPNAAAHRHGFFKEKTVFVILYCDLLNKKAQIDFELTGYGSHRNDGADLSWRNGLLSARDIITANNQLFAQTPVIYEMSKNRQSSSQSEGSVEAKYIASVGQLATQLLEGKIKMEDLSRGEFIDLAMGLIDQVTGLPVKITEKKAQELQKKLYRKVYIAFGDDFKIDGTFY